MLFLGSELRHVDEIPDPGPLLGRIEGVRICRRDACLVTDRVSDLLRTSGFVQSDAKDMEADFS